MTTVQLVRLEPMLEATLAKDPAFMDALGSKDWVRAATIVHGIVGRTLVTAPISVDELQWGGYFTLDAATREVIGSCAFKTPPTDERTVEIAYFTYPGFEGRGYATAMAQKLIALASSSGAVKRVIAHTLPRESASTSVLRKVGMTCVGEVIDPDDGRVWRWQRETGV